MKIIFHDKDLERLEIDMNYTHDLATGIVKAYRKRVQFIRAAINEQTFYSWKSLHFERLQGQRSHQFSMRLNDQWRLIIEIANEGAEKVVFIIDIEDYHK